MVEFDGTADEFNWRPVLLVCWAYHRFIVSVTLLGLLVFIGIAYVKKDSYESSAGFIVRSNEVGELVNVGGLISVRTLQMLALSTEVKQQAYESAVMAWSGLEYLPVGDGFGGFQSCLQTSLSSVSKSDYTLVPVVELRVVTSSPEISQQIVQFWVDAVVHKCDELYEQSLRVEALQLESALKLQEVKYHALTIEFNKMAETVFYDILWGTAGPGLFRIVELNPAREAAAGSLSSLVIGMQILRQRLEVISVDRLRALRNQVIVLYQAEVNPRPVKSNKRRMVLGGTLIVFICATLGVVFKSVILDDTEVVCSGAAREV